MDSSPSSKEIPLVLEELHTSSEHSSSSAQPKTPKHHESNGTFFSPWETWEHPSVFNVAKVILNRSAWPTLPSAEDLDKIYPVHKPQFIPSFSEHNSVRITWLGHASVLIQMGGLNILTDPVYENKCSPTQFVGVHRYRPPPCENVADLPPIHIVCISHNHYDHLSFPTCKSLFETFDPIFMVPLKLDKWFTNNIGTKKVYSLDWWESKEFNISKISKSFSNTTFSRVSSPDETMSEVSESSMSSTPISGIDNIVFSAVPAQHWSKRTAWDTNTTLWCGWVIHIDKFSTVYFAGDTGYCPVFKEIGNKFDIDVGLIPIGAYSPRSFFKPQHVNPEEAVEIHKDIGATHSIAIHYATWILTQEPVEEPPKLLKLAADSSKVDFVSIPIGSHKTFVK